MEQGEIAAENALDGQRTYSGTLPVTMLKVVGVDLLSVGRFQAQAGEHEIDIEDSDEHSYRKLVIAGGRLVGAILIARPQDAPHCHGRRQGGARRQRCSGRARRREWQSLAEPEAVLGSA